MAQTVGQPQFNIGNLIQQSWQTVQKNLVVLVGGTVIVTLALGIADGILYSVIGLPGVGRLIIGGPLLLGYQSVILRAVRGQSPQFPHVFEGFNRFVPAFLANLVMSIPLVLSAIPIIGLVFAAVGIVVQFICVLTYFYMFDRKSDFLPALDASRKTITGAIVPWFVLVLVCAVIAAAGVFGCLIGIFVTIPIAAGMLALAYDQVAGGVSVEGGYQQ